MGFLRTGIKDGIISVLTEDDIAVPDGVADSTARLALRGFPRGARVYQTDNGFWYELTNAAAPSDAASWQGMPKKYVALLTQTGTDAPVATVLENSLGGTPTYGYVDPGTYTVTLAGAFTANKTAFLMGPISDGSGQNAGAVYNNVNEAGIYTATLGTLGNGLLSGVLLQILVYP